MTDIEEYLRELTTRAAAARTSESAPAPAEGIGSGEAVVYDLAGGETLYIVEGDDDVRLLLATEPEIHRGHVWTKGEIRALVAVEDDPEVLAQIRRLKRTIPGRLTQE